jgi:hypothetical protein
MDDPFDGLGPKPLSRFRIIGLVFFVLLILGFYAYTTPDSIGHAYITGRCFRTPLPGACRFRSQREFVPPDFPKAAVGP